MSSSPTIPRGNGMQILSNRESEALLKEQKAKAMRECKAQMIDFTSCTSTRTISMAWACREQKKALMDCLRLYTSEEALEAEKGAYMARSRSALKK